MTATDQRIIRTPRRLSELPPAAPQTVPAPADAAAPPPAPPAPPATVGEAESRFWRRYGLDLGAALLGMEEIEKPQTVEGWIALAEATRDVLRARAAGRRGLAGDD